MRYQITHTTTYKYDSPTSVSHHLLRLTPHETLGQKFIEHSLVTEPKPALLVSHQDYFGNAVTFLTVDEPHQRLNVTARSIVEVVPRQPPEVSNTPAWEQIRELCSGHTYTTAHEACEFRFRSPLVPCRPEFADYAAGSFQPERPMLGAALHLMGRIHQDFKFDSKATTVATPLEQVLRQRRGVCQDFPHQQNACLRSM
jgi:transglutaminase-like putative cysteine protease